MDLLLLSTGRRIGMALLTMPIQTAGLNELPSRLNPHGTAISNTVRQVAGAVGTSLLVTIMTDRTKVHIGELAAGGALTKEQMIVEASIQGINDAYVWIIGFAAVALALSFFLANKRRAPVTELVPAASAAIAERD